MSERRYIDRYIEIQRNEIEREGMGGGVGIKYFRGGTYQREEDMLG